MVPPRVVSSTSRQTSRNRAGRAWILRPVASVAAVALLAVAGCGGSSKPSYCSDRSNLESSVKGLTSAATSGDVSALKSQVTTIKSDATSVVSSAKSDFPTQTSAIKSSVDALGDAVKHAPVESIGGAGRHGRECCGECRELGQELLGRHQFQVLAGWRGVGV